VKIATLITTYVTFLSFVALVGVLAILLPPLAANGEVLVPTLQPTHTSTNEPSNLLPFEFYYGVAVWPQSPFKVP
jgi:hypothetical protein